MLRVLESSFYEMLIWECFYFPSVKLLIFLFYVILGYYLKCKCSKINKDEKLFLLAEWVYFEKLYPDIIFRWAIFHRE